MVRNVKIQSSLLFHAHRLEKSVFQPARPVVLFRGGSWFGVLDRMATLLSGSFSAGDCSAGSEARAQALEVVAADMVAAVEKAVDASETLIKLIRSELGIKPSRIPHIEDHRDGQRANWSGLLGPPDPECSPSGEHRA